VVDFRGFVVQEDKKRKLKQTDMRFIKLFLKIIQRRKLGLKCLAWSYSKVSGWV